MSKLPFAPRRRAVETTAHDPVRLEPLLPGRAIPLRVSPAVPGLDLLEWAGRNRERVDRLLWEHKALLFRGFHGQSASRLPELAAATADGPPLEYRDRTTPRTRLESGAYTSTIYPAARPIHLHNEGTYWTRWPLKLYFGCITAASSGGATPLADVGAVLHRLSPATRERFAALGFLLVRNFNDGFGLPWQEVFQTDDRAEVERYCRENRIELEWRGGDRLRTRQARPAIRRHPRTGREVWFNHAAFFHLTTYPEDVREALLAEVGLDGLPYNTFYGDGSEIEPEVAAEIRAAYDAESVAFPWQQDDVLLLDNMSVAHGREPYSGERLVAAAMHEPWEDAA